MDSNAKILCHTYLKFDKQWPTYENNTSQFDNEYRIINSFNESNFQYVILVSQYVSYVHQGLTKITCTTEIRCPLNRDVSLQYD